MSNLWTKIKALGASIGVILGMIAYMMRLRGQRDDARERADEAEHREAVSETTREVERDVRSSSADERRKWLRQFAADDD